MARTGGYALGILARRRPDGFAADVERLNVPKHMIDLFELIAPNRALAKSEADEDDREPDHDAELPHRISKSAKKRNAAAR